MIPHDCSVVIPEFYLKHLKGMAYATAKRQRAEREFVVDLEQEAVAEFLSVVSAHQLANPSQRHWDAVRPAVQRAVTKACHEEVRRDESLEDHPGLLESVEETAEEAPSWVPSDPVARQAIVTKCRKILKNAIRPQRAGKRKTFSVDLTLMGAHVIMSGNFTTAEEAQAARDESLRRLIDWCTPIQPEVEESGDSAARFVELHRGAGAKPTVFYGDPLKYLVYLEDFRERVGHGHRYYVGDAGYERVRRTLAGRAAHP